MLKQIIGLDHVVIAVRDLDGAANGWQALGFTLSPRGTHSAHMGTGNYTIMFGEDYLELLGVLEPTPPNAPMRAFLAQREGIERTAFTTIDAQAGVDELQARGIEATGPMDFGRPVQLPGGGSAQAAFRTYNWPVHLRPGGLRLFACQHLTRDVVWIDELKRHRNGAQRILRIEILSSDPGATATQMAGLIDQPANKLADGSWRIESGGGRAAFVFMDRDTLVARYPGLDGSTLADDCAAALVLQTANLDQASQALGAAARQTGSGGVFAGPAEANGLIVAFEAA